MFKKIKESQKRISREVRHQTATYVLAALGFVVGLAWNDAVKSLIEFLFPLDKSGNIFVKFVYAFLVTVVIIAATIVLTRRETEQNS